MQTELSNSTCNYKSTHEFWIDTLNDMDTEVGSQMYSSMAECNNRITYDYMLDSRVARQIYLTCEGNYFKVYILLLSVCSILIKKYEDREDLTIASPVFYTEQTLKSKQVKEFIPIRDRDKHLLCFKNYSLELNEAVKKSYDNQSYPVNELTEKLGIRKGLLYGVVASLENIHGSMPDNTLLNTYNNRIYINFSAKEDGLRCLINYHTDGFKLVGVERFATHLKNLINQVVEAPGKRICELELATPEEKEQLRAFNGADSAYPKHNTLHQLIEEQAQKTPDNIAAVYGDKKMSYKELNEKANQLAHQLREKGVQPEEIVGVMSEKSLEMLIGILGVLKAGGAYLPIDPVYPEERIRYMLEDSGSRILLTQRGSEIIPDYGKEVLYLEDEELYQLKKTNPEPVCGGESLAYIIYTSGTTGKPKGIQTEHRNVLAYVNYFNKQFGMSETDATLQQASITFDGFVEEVYSILSVGGKVVVPTDADVKEVKRLKKIIDLEGVTILSCSPMILSGFNQLEPMNSVRIYLNSSDVLKKEYFDQLEGRGEIYNMYGPSEATVCTTCYRCSGDEGDRIPIGKPIDNYRVYILNASRMLQPVGVPGELCISGEGLSRGYLKQSELTGEKFVENPHEPGQRMYRTGDLARWLVDGNIEYLGRIDQQVKIRGYRIELGEIENRLLAHNHVKEAVVIPWDDAYGSKYLCGYVVGDRELTVGELREHLGKELPEYMLPSYYVQLDKIPLNPNGKVDRKALPEPAGEMETGAAYEAPRDGIETKLIEIWQEVLKVDKLGINDNFFELGGHSLKAISVAARIHKVLNVEVPLIALFKTPTIKTLAEYIKGQEKNAYTTIQPVEESAYYGLSSVQKRLYTLQQFDPESTVYNMGEVLCIEGELDVEKLKAAFEKLVVRHEALRTSFERVDDEVFQKVHNEVPLVLEYTYVENEQEAEAFLKGFVRSFDLSIAPLMRVGLIRSHPQSHILMFDMHHIISDGTSMEIIVDEFAKLYQGKEVKPLAIQYKDFSHWQNEQYKSERMKVQEAYWIQEFEGEIPVLNLPADYPRPAVQSFEGDRVYFELDDEAVTGLRGLERKTGATLYMLLLSAFQILLSKYSELEDVVVGTPVAGRAHADLEGLVGMFVNTLVIRSRPEGCKTYREYLEEIKGKCHKAYENQDYPFEELVEKLNIKRDLSRNPLFDIMFVLQNMESGETQIENLRIMPYQHQIPVSKFDMTLEAEEIGARIRFTLEYCTRLYKRETVERLSRHYMQILGSLTEVLELPISELTLVTAEEKNTLLYEFNDTVAAYPKDKTLHQFFEEQAARTPDNIAAVYEGQQLTYRELNEKANQLAKVLRQKDVTADTIVGLMVERSLEMLVGLLGILKAGGAYLPIDPDYPVDRIGYMLEDSGTKLLLTQTHLRGRHDFDGTLLELDDDSLYTGECSNLEPACRPHNLAYVIYTSGSTGKPKGVMLEHKGIVSLRKLFKDFDIGTGDRIIQFASFSFDASAWEIYMALLTGGSLYIIPKKKILNQTDFNEFIKSNRITVGTIPPNFLSYLNKESVKHMKMLISAGSVLTHSHVYEWKEAVNLVNAYGPTEATICATVLDCRKSERVSIGKPIWNTRIYIIDSNNNLMPIGAAGELYIAGEGLARGYLNRPELTAEKFVGNPYEPGKLMYRTGDLARWLPDGNIEFLGRIDYQVKIRGFRIELEEIENLLMSYETVKEAAVIAREDGTSDKYLCAYFAAEHDITGGALREYLGKTLPDYMVPSYFIRLEKMPLTPNGKLDRKALPEPEESGTMGKVYEPPTSELEEQLVASWKEVLKIKQLSINDNFFELGGDSIKAVKLIAKLKEIEPSLKMSHLYQYGNIKTLAAAIGAKAKQEEQKPPSNIEKMVNEAFHCKSMLVEYTEQDKTIIVLYCLGHEAGVATIRDYLRDKVTENVLPDFIVAKPETGLCFAQTGVLSTDLGLEKLEIDKAAKILLESLDHQLKSYEKAIISQRIKQSYRPTPMQEIQMNQQRTTGTVLRFETYLDIPALNEVFRDLVGTQGLLRSVLNQDNGESTWIEYETPECLEIPFVDLSSFEMEDKGQVLTKILENRFLSNYEYNGKLLYRVLLVKETEKDFQLALPFSHVIFDGMSGELIKNYIHAAYSKYRNKEHHNLAMQYDYASFAGQVGKGPQHVTEEEILSVYELEVFLKANEMLMNMINEKKTSNSRVFDYKVPYTEKELEKDPDYVMNLSQSLLAALVKRYLGISKIPLSVIHDGRRCEEKEYYNVVGMFVTDIPVMLELDNREDNCSPWEKIIEKTSYAVKHNINFTALFSDKEIGKKFGKIKTLVEKQTSEPCISLNFIGEKGDEEIRLLDKLINEDEESRQERLNHYHGGIHMEVMYTQTYIKLMFILPFEIDVEKLEALFVQGEKLFLEVDSSTIEYIQ